jgi:hypothetical protein
MGKRRGVTGEARIHRTSIQTKKEKEVKNVSDLSIH